MQHTHTHIINSIQLYDRIRRHIKVPKHKGKRDYSTHPINFPRQYVFYKYPSDIQEQINKNRHSIRPETSKQSLTLEASIRFETMSTQSEAPKHVSLGTKARAKQRVW